MKATEMMMGDWVMYNPNVFIEDEYESFKEWEKIRIQSGEDFNLADEDCYEPIPLTPEILEKNGFERGNQYWYLPNNANPIEFSIDDDWECGKHYFGVCCGKPFPLNYVHELQHALRLCGLDGLATNFKV